MRRSGFMESSNGVEQGGAAGENGDSRPIADDGVGTEDAGKAIQQRLRSLREQPVRDVEIRARSRGVEQIGEADERATAIAEIVDDEIVAGANGFDAKARERS